MPKNVQFPMPVDAATHRVVADVGFRCFDTVERFRDHVRRDVLGEGTAQD